MGKEEFCRNVEPKQAVLMINYSVDVFETTLKRSDILSWLIMLIVKKGVYGGEATQISPKLGKKLTRLFPDTTTRWSFYLFR